MHSLKVVIVDEPADPSPCLLEIDEEGALDQLPPKGTPESFDLTEGLRSSGPGNHVTNAPLFQFLGKGTLASPRDILRAVVTENFLRSTEAGDAGTQDFDH